MLNIKSEQKSKNGKDFAFFVDVRNETGDILYYPCKLGKVKIWSPYKKSFETQPIWQIEVRLSEEKFRKCNPFELSLATVGEPSSKFNDRLKKESIIKKIFNDTGYTTRDAKNTVNALHNIMDDLYTNADDRFIYELLQNADDQPQERKEVSVFMQLLESHLLFMHNGRPFDDDDVDSICSIGSSTKRNSKEKIGYKGIGFKSVFTGSDTVFVNSGNFSFAFDKYSALYNDSNIEDIPWQLKPIWQEKYRCPLEVRNNKDFWESQVGISLDINEESINDYDRSIQKILSSPIFLLFLKNVSSFRYQHRSMELMISKKADGNIIYIKNNEKIINSWIKGDFTVKIPQNIRDAMQNDSNVPQKMKEATMTQISFAAIISNNQIGQLDNSVLYAYLPTSVNDFKFNFIVNADFLLTANREQLHTKKLWNQFLFRQMGRLLIEWSKSISTHIPSYLELFPTTLPEEETGALALSSYFNSSYKSALKSEAFILNHKGELAKQDEIIIDKTGLSEIIGANLFCKLLGTEKCLPSEKIDSKILEKDIFEHIELLKFDDVIDAITNNDAFNNWFVPATDEKKKRLYKWIQDNNTTHQDKIESFVSKLPFSKLTVEGRRTLFSSLAEKLKKEIALFKNMNGEYKPLGEMVTCKIDHPTWLNNYVIAEEEYCSNLDNYLISKENVFEEIVWKHRDEFNISVTDLYKGYKWTDEIYTQQLIEQHKGNDEYRQILSIVEESGKSIKEQYLQNIDRLNLTIGEEKKYKKDSYEYRVLHLALSVYEEPSDFSSKIYFDGQCIKDFSVSDDVVCEYTQNGGTKKVKMSLAKLLPQYQNQSDSINKIKGLFEIQNDLDCFFVAKPKPHSEIFSELNSIYNVCGENWVIDYPFYRRTGRKIYHTEKHYAWDVEIPAYQFIYFLINNNCYFSEIKIEKKPDEFIYEFFDLLYKWKIEILNASFTHHLTEYLSGKFFKSEYSLEREQLIPAIEQWAANNDKKKKYLIDNGVQTSESYAIQFRKLFLEDKPIDFIDKLSDEEINSGIEFLATVSVFKRPFVGENQKKILLSLKDKCKDEWDDKKMKENSRKWDTKEYSEWIKDHSLQIFIYPGMLPCQLSYDDEILLNYDDSEYDYYYNSPEKKLFVSDVRKIEDILFEVAKEEEGKSDLNFDDYKFLCWGEDKVSVSKEDIEDKEETIKSLTEENRKKDEIIKQYRAKYGDLIEEVLSPTNEPQAPESNSIEYIHSNAQNEIYQQSGKVIERDGLSRDEQAAAHREAEKVIKDKLKKAGYRILDEENNGPYKKWQSVNQVKNIINPQNETINLVIKSAKGGYIYLSATDFEFLTSNSNNILMVWDGKNVHSVTAEDIFNKDSNVNLIFDTEYTPKHYYAALSKVFQYIKRTTFAVKNPSYNACDTIKSFGMDAKTEGVQELFDDNDL